MITKIYFFEGYSWFKFNNLGLVLGMTLNFYTTVAKELRVRKFKGLTPTFVEVTWEKLVESFFAQTLPHRVIISLISDEFSPKPQIVSLS